MAKLPVMFSSGDEIALKSAVLLYHGVAFLDANMSIDNDVLKKISHKYGSIIY